MIALFSSETRLYELAWRDCDPALLVEAWWGRERLNGGFELQIDCLGEDAFIDPASLLGHAARLLVSLADGTRSGRSGLVRAAVKRDADGGFCRYRLTLVPWSWLLSQARHNRVFQEKTVIEIVDQVFSDYAEHAAWHWSEEVEAFLAEARPRSYCVQYRESDYAFVSRLLAEEGLGWCIEEDAAAPAGHRMRIFADSGQLPEDALSSHADGGRGIRFHRADSQEEQDAIVAFGRRRGLSITFATGLAYDYRRKRAIAASVPTARAPGGAQAPVIESYDFVGACAWASDAEAERYQRLAMEAAEAHAEVFIGRGTVRSFRPGSAFLLSQSPLDALDQNTDERSFSLLDLTHAGINNLSGVRIAAIAARLASDELACGPQSPPGADVHAPVVAPQVLQPELIRLASERGYGNSFECLCAQMPWRPRLEDDTGVRSNPRPTAPGPMSAIVVGPQGETAPSGVDELWCDALGRLKVRFHWQRAEQALARPDEQLSCWLRPVSRQAGAGMGWQWLPRIGQEVLVGFVEGDIDRPVILGALYNGRGEGGVVPTPGGEAAGEADLSVFDTATDQHPGGQGNLAGGASPAWHGAASASHRHAAALSGFRSKEFGAHGPAAGHNQLLFDDSDDQQRIQLRSSQHDSELNLGHLIHQAGNFRGSFRGAGVELRTDGWGALRGGQGLLMTSWASGSEAEPAGDLAAGMGLVRQAEKIAEMLSGAAAVHQTVQLAGAIGTRSAAQCVIDSRASPLKAFVTAASGMVAARRLDRARGDAAAKSTTVAKDTLPHTTDPLIFQAAKAGLGMVAGQNLQWSCGETVTLMSGADTNLAVAGTARIHSGQAIGLLAGASGAGEGNTGISMIAARDDIDLQAQGDELRLQSKQDLKLVSAAAHIDFAAAKRIVLAVSGGASITIDGGITVACPGTITVHASKKSFGGPASMAYALPNFPRGEFRQKKRYSFST